MRIAPNFRDLTGMVFGRLTVIKIKSRDKGIIKWECKCSCGGTSFVGTGNLRNGHTKSCGCLESENLKNLAGANKTHGESHRSIEYRAWCKMKDRCGNERSKDWADYGGRGIKVCERWLNSFENFLTDMGRRPQSGFSLNRKNNDADYSPDNCTWSNAVEQANNKRNTRWITIKGETMSLPNWCRKFNMNYYCVFARIAKGINPEVAITTPSGKL